MYFYRVYTGGGVSKRKWLLVIVGMGLSLFSSKALALAESTGTGGCNAQAVHSLGYRGQGVNIGLMGNLNLYANHEAFFDKDSNGLPTGPTHAFNYDVTNAGIVSFDHDTWMAGIAVSRGGREHPNDIGVARSADIHCARVTSGGSVYITSGLNKLIIDNNCRVITTAFVLSETPNGQSRYTLIYDYYAYEHNDVVFANAAGNEDNDTDEIFVFGDAFNGITTGGLVDANTGIYDKVGKTSGTGKTADLRRKPDVTAPSSYQMVPRSGTSIWTIPPYNTGHTSLAGPHVAGVAALLISLADETANQYDHLNEVIRAVIVNSAFPNINDEDGLGTNPATTVWNKDRGYGRLDALRAHLLLSSPQVNPGTTTQSKGWAYEIMTEESQTDHYYITAQKDQRLVLTATWNRKVNKNGSHYSEESSRLNLDLQVIGPFSQILFEEDSVSDNLEKVDILLPNDGTYEIILEKTTDHTDRGYAMAFELIDKIPADFNIDYIADANDLAQLTDDWLLPVTAAPTDLYKDGFINLKDLSVFASYWQKSNTAYY